MHRFSMTVSPLVLVVARNMLLVSYLNRTTEELIFRKWLKRHLSKING